MLRFTLKILATIIKVSKPLERNTKKKFFELHKNGLYADIDLTLKEDLDSLKQDLVKGRMPKELFNLFRAAYWLCVFSG